MLDLMRCYANKLVDNVNHPVYEIKKLYAAVKQEHTEILAAGFLADLPSSATFDCSQTCTPVLVTSTYRVVQVYSP